MSVIAELRVGARPSARTPEYFQGSTVTWECDTRNALTRAAVDVTDPVFVWRAPNGTTLRVTATRVALGLYRAATGVVAPGIWNIRFEAEGIALDERRFDVVAGAFAVSPSAVAQVSLTEDGVIIINE